MDRQSTENQGGCSAYHKIISSAIFCFPDPSTTLATIATLPVPHRGSALSVGQAGTVAIPSVMREQFQLPYYTKAWYVNTRRVMNLEAFTLN